MDSVDSRDEEAPLVADSLEIETKKNSTRDIHILSVAFLLIFLAYGAAQNLQSTVNTKDNLGTISLGILYTSFTFFSLFASLVVRILGSKNAMILGSTGYWLYVAANLAPSWYTMVPASAYLGFTASIIWVGEGTYLTSAARIHASENKLHEGTVIGNFNGEFWAFFALHQFAGNLIAFAVLKDGTDGSDNGTTLLFIAFLIIMTLGTVLMFFLRKEDGKGKDPAGSSINLCSYVATLSKSIITPLFDIRMILIIPLIAYSGLQQAFVWAEFTKEVVTPALGLRGVGSSMAVYGAFDAICSLAAGRFTSGLKSITFIVSGGVLAQAFVLFWLLLKYSLTTGVLGILYPLLMAALLGIGDGVLNTQLSALVGILFKNDTEGAFAQLKVWQCACIAIIFFIYPYISLPTMLIIMIIGICISVVGVLFLTIWVEKAFSSSSS